MSQQASSPAGTKTSSGRQYTFASRMAKTPKSFIREILKVTEDPRIISFAGGLPNPGLIDVDGIARATATVLVDEIARTFNARATRNAWSISSSSMFCPML